MKKILSAATLLVCAVSYGQNINPTVEVTNIYQGNPSEVHKPQLGMAIPDSLMRFDMDFGYEVFEKPYQGAYNFKPYMLAMRPDKDAYRGKSLYLKTGAGYSLHPQLDFVFSPEQSGPFQMSVYANHRSYFGKYNSLTTVPYEEFHGVEKVPGQSFNGHDLLTSVGLDGRCNWDKAILSFGIGYYGQAARDTIFKNSFDAADFNARIRSNRDDDRYIFYDVALDGRFGRDRHKYFSTGASNMLSEGLFRLHGEAGPVLSRSQAALLGFEAETCSYRNYFEDNAGKVALIPKYRFSYGDWDFDLGVRIEKLFGGKDEEGSLPIHSFKGSWLFPAVNVSYALMDNLQLYASATGGNRINTFSSILSRNHFIQLDQRYSMLDNSTEKINVKIGAKGRYGSMLQFEVDGGAAVIENGLLDYGYASSLTGPEYLPGVVYSDYSLIYADALMDLHVGDVRFEGGLHLRHSALKFDTDGGLMLPAFTCDFKTVYDFNPRLYAGARIITSTSRRGKCSAPDGVNTPYYDIKIPGYFDLGLFGGYKLNRKLGVWLESGNLLCESIQRNLFYSEKDLWITAGITLNL